MSDPINLAVLREAVDVYADSLIEYYDQTGLEKKQFRSLTAAARALLEGEREWLCQTYSQVFIQPADSYCQGDDPSDNKHTDCGWVVIIPVSEEE